MAFLDSRGDNRILSVYDLNPTEDCSHDDGDDEDAAAASEPDDALTRKQKIGGMDCEAYDSDRWFVNQFFYEDLLISCSNNSGRVIAWSTENGGKLRYRFQSASEGRFKWVQSQDRIYALKTCCSIATLQTFNALDGSSLSTVNLVFDDADKKLRYDVVEFFVCGKWFVIVDNEVGLYVFDLESGVQKSFTSLPEFNLFVQASDDPFKFCGKVCGGNQVCTYHCEKDSGLLHRISTFRTDKHKRTSK